MSSKGIYFQEQGFFSMNCGVHCLNNLVGYQQFTKRQLTEICYSLSDEFINPHKHVFGGDFDVNVLMIALKARGYSIEFMDMRKQITLTEDQESIPALGYIINEVIARAGFFKKVGSLFSERHWTCIRKINGNYWLLNSKQKEPMMIGDGKDLEKYFAEKRNQGDQICTVIKN